MIKSYQPQPAAVKRADNTVTQNKPSNLAGSEHKKSDSEKLNKIPKKKSK